MRSFSVSPQSEGLREWDEAEAVLQAVLRARCVFYFNILPQPEVRSKAVLLLYNVLYPKAEGEGEFGDPYYIMASAFCISAGAI